MNKKLGSTLLVAGTMIGAGMLAMPLTSAGIGFTWTVILLLALWLLLTYSALLFVEGFQTTDSEASIGTLAGQYFGKWGKIVTNIVLLVFLYALLAAYIAGGGGIVAQQVANLQGVESAGDGLKIVSAVVFTLIFGGFVAISTKVVDAVNRLLFVAMLVAFALVLVLMLPKLSLGYLLEMPLDYALLVSASPVFFTSFGFHGSIHSLNRYLEGNVAALRGSVVMGSLITLAGYIVWQLATHGVLSQATFTEIITQKPNLQGLVEAIRVVTGSNVVAGAVALFSALALITSFLGVALGLLECLDDLLVKSCNKRLNRLVLSVMTFLPSLLFVLFYPEGFIKALGYAGQMFAFYAVVLPAALAWQVRKKHPNLPYRVKGGYAALLVSAVMGLIIVHVPFLIKWDWLPAVIG